MKIRILTTLAAAAAIACGGAEAGESGNGQDGTNQSAAETQPAESSDGDAVADARVVPQGTRMEIEISDGIGPEINTVGDVFTAHVDDPVVARDGRVAIPEDAPVTGEITGLYAGDAERPAAVRVDLQTVAVGDRDYDLPVEVIDTKVSTMDRLSEVDDTGEEAGIGAVAGAVLGGVIGGDAEAAVLGGALGAGAGSAISLGQGAGDELPSGSNFIVRTVTPMELAR